MPHLLKLILDWSEVWALLIPLAVLIWKRKIRAEAIPLGIYVCIALVLNVMQDYIWKNQLVFFYSSQPGDNNIIYNIHSFIRLLLFSWFFIKIKQPFQHKIKKIVPIAFVIIMFANFVFLGNNFTSFSSRLLGLEALGILYYCMVYFLNLLIYEDGIPYKKNATFWMVTGISIYVVINFPIFIFYKSFSETAQKFAIDIWDLHNITYIILCFFLAKYFFTDSHE
jgi:hypothetical protein